MKLIQFSLLVGLSAALAFSGCKKEEDDPCKNVVCQNGGTCNGGSCACASGYEGTTCGTEMRAKFIGQYNGTITCSGAANALNMSINSSSAGITSVVFNDGVDTWVGTVNGTSINIATQTLSGGVTVSGSGQISGLILNLNLNLSGNTCTYTGTKQ